MKYALRLQVQKIAYQPLVCVITELNSGTVTPSVSASISTIRAFPSVCSACQWPRDSWAQWLNDNSKYGKKKFTIGSLKEPQDAVIKTHSMESTM